jgi:hypothetical protein
MAMPVFVGASSKDFLVPLLGPLGIVKLMCRIEMLNPGQINHDVWMDLM